MRLNYEMSRYTELTGEDGTKIPISRLGGYINGYEKGRADAIDEFVEKMKKYWGGLRAMDEIERVAEQLKEEVFLI